MSLADICYVSPFVDCDMPFTELFRMSNEKVDAIPERAANSSNPSSRPEADFCELVWENGQIVMQGQSSKSRKGPFSTNDYQSLTHNSQDGRDVNGLKMNKFSTMDSVLSEMGLGHDVDIPWLSYPVEDSLHNDYNCDFLPGLSGVTLNDIPIDNNSAFREKKSGSSNMLKHDFLRSGVSGITSDNVGSTQNVTSQGFDTSSLCAFTSLRLQKLDSGQPSTTTSFTNFPYFSRPTSLAKANHVTVNTSRRSENDERVTTTDSTVVNLGSACSRKEIGAHHQPVQANVNELFESSPSKTVEDLVLTKRALNEESCMNDFQENYPIDTMKGKVGMGVEKNMEPIIAASSVCSGNSVDIASNERAYDLKRKSRETTESEGPSDEFEDESMGAKKAAHARASSKRSRAAEVHNLSERKRRDRINEKMRALQELIPNCNKVDKASMLDEAIEYLKTLQLQVQMMSMGAGMYMQPLMVPPGMPHFSPMGLGMGPMGFGMNMFGPHYPVPGIASPFQGMPGPSLPPFGHPSQSSQMSIHPIPGAPPLNTPMMGLDVSDLAGSSGASNLITSSTPKDSDKQIRTSSIPNNSMNQATNQACQATILDMATKEVIHSSPPSHDRRPNVNASESPLPASGTNDTHR